MDYHFTVTINKEGKWFVARCVELGVVARKNLKEATQLYLEKEKVPLFRFIEN